jgi:hypothetical protein
MKGAWEHVLGFFDFQQVYDAAIDSAPMNAVFVEVGTLFGRSAIYMAEQIALKRPDISFFVVDTWVEWPDACSTLIFGEGTYKAEIDKHGSLFAAFANNVERSGYRSFIQVIRMDSARAAALFTGEVRPWFVFIDANHTYESCKRDIAAWHPTLDDAGYLAGHDYEPQWPGVVKAVDEFYEKAARVGNSWVGIQERDGRAKKQRLPDSYRKELGWYGDDDQTNCG